MKLKFLLPVVLFAAVAALLYKGLFLNPSELPSALIGKPVPEFTLPPLPLPGADARPGLSSADLKGAPSLVNMFASWCIPCKAEHPFIQRLAESKAIAVYAINYKDKSEDAAAWLKELGNPYERIGADRDGRVAIDWGVYGVPESYIIDSQGIIRYRHVGPITLRDIDETILPLIKSLQQ